MSVVGSVACGPPAEKPVKFLTLDQEGNNLAERGLAPAEQPQRRRRPNSWRVVEAFFWGVEIIYSGFDDDYDFGGSERQQAGALERGKISEQWGNLKQPVAP